MTPTKTLLICVYGIVQGVGFRPFVSRAADRLGLKGSVANKGSYVEIHVQGSDSSLEQFLTVLEKEAPERSAILKVDTRETSEAPDSTRIPLACQSGERHRRGVSACRVSQVYPFSPGSFACSESQPQHRS